MVYSYVNTENSQQFFCFILNCISSITYREKLHLNEIKQNNLHGNTKQNWFSCSQTPFKSNTYLF